MIKTEVRSLCAKAIAAKIPTIAEHESKQILKSYGVTVPEGRLATRVDEALQIADEVGYPVVAKAVAAGLLHKTEQQAVHLNLDNPQAIRNSWQEIEQHFSSQKLSLDGILVEKMISDGAEFIIGLQNDPHFGPVIMLGTGGTLIHLFNDVTFRALPVTVEDIKDAITGIAFFGRIGIGKKFVGNNHISMHPVVIADRVKKPAVQKGDLAIKTAVITIVMTSINAQRFIK